MKTLTTSVREAVASADFSGIGFNHHLDFKGLSAINAPWDAVTDKMISGDRGDDTMRQAFCKVCFAIAATQPIHYSAVKPDSNLETFFPRKGRRQRIRAFQQALGVDIQLVVVKDSLEWSIIAGALGTLILLFVAWKAAFVCFAATLVLGWLAQRFGTDLKLGSIRQLTEEIARERYL
ncbi:MAG TPA: hypothetical protein VGM41_20425 [Chitinophagaceae bacterium]